MRLHIFHSNHFIKESQEILINTNSIFVVLNNNEKIRLRKVQYLNHNELTDIIIKKEPSRIILHYLTAAKIKPLIESGYSGEVHWSAWGGDLYNSLFNFKNNEFYEEETLLYLKKNKLNSKGNIMYRNHKVIPKNILLFIYRIVKLKKHDYQITKEFLNRIDYCSTVLPYEFSYIKQLCPNVEYRPYVYGNIDYLTTDLKNDVKLGTKILVGNSGTPSNNHVTVYKQLTNFNIISPVVYGDKEYINTLRNDYKNINFITNRLPLNKYTELLTSCNTMIINVIRQQSVGNILLGIHLGMRVYLNEKSKMLPFFKSLGIKIFSFQTDFKKYSNTQLTLIDIHENKINLEKYWGKKNVNKFIANYFEN